MVRKPSRPPLHSASQEWGSVRKKWKDRLPVALLFPNRYGLGMSNLGLQLVYSLANDHPAVVCERFFFSADAAPPRSLESGRPLADFPVILYSVSFEDDFVNLLAMLSRGGIPLTSAERQQGAAQGEPGRPLVIGGGVAVMINPEPLAVFSDLMVIGEAELVLPSLLDRLVAPASSRDRQALLAALADELVGCYVPRFYTPAYRDDGGLAALKVAPGLPERVARPFVTQSAVAGHSRLLSPAAEFSNLFLVELGRGCSRGCRFCAAGFVYRPPRLWPAASIIAALEERPANIRRVGLLGMEMADGDELARLAEYLLAGSCALSFSSLRADALSPALLKLLAASKVRTVVLAPDGCSERLRRVINKGISERDVLDSARLLAEAGIVHLKLYVMIGLPTEEEEDLEELVAMLARLRQELLKVGRRRGRLVDITLSVNSFVPKPWTPFQFHPMARLAVLKKRIRFLRRRLARQPNLKLTVEQPLRPFFQAALARGDRRLAPALAELAAGGGPWRQVFAKHGLAPDWYACRARGRDELLPWEVIDHRIRRDYLWAEYRRGLMGKTTPPCAVDRCRRCGVCHD